MPTAQEIAKDQKYGPIVAKVNSSSDPDTVYEVRRTHEGTLSCQCMGWRFNKDTPRQCRHTRAAANGNLPAALPASKRPVAVAVPQTPKAVHAEAASAATEIVRKGMGLADATKRIEEAIRKFLIQIAEPTQVADVEYGVRMITLED